MAEPIPEVHAINAVLLDIEGAGQYLNLTPRHVRDLAYLRELAVVKVAAKVRFRTCDLDDFIAARVREADR